jgi:uncharacterized protein YneR
MHRLSGGIIAFVLISAGFSPAFAQRQPAEPGSDRFRFEVTDKGILRFDSRSGEVSQCTVGVSGAICRAAPDERAAFEKEIARLETENAGLRKALADRNADPAPPVPPAAIPDSSGPPSADAPAAAEPARGRVRTALDTAWRNLVALMTRMKSALPNG